MLSQSGAIYKALCQRGCGTVCLSKWVKKKAKQEEEGDLFLRTSTTANNSNRRFPGTCPGSPFPGKEIPPLRPSLCFHPSALVGGDGDRGPVDRMELLGTGEMWMMCGEET